MLGGDEEIARLTAERVAAKARLAAATTDAEKEAAQLQITDLDAQMNKVERDKSNLAQSENMMSALTDQWKDKWKHSTDLMESHAIGLSEQGAALRLDSQKPHLVSLNLDDALSTGVTLYYVDEGETKLGKAGTKDKMGSSPDIELLGEEVLPEHCSIANVGDETVTLTPLAPPEFVQVNGVGLTEPCELQQGMMIVLGRDNIFRFNHPRQASRLREMRASGETSTGPSPTKLGTGGSGIFSLNQIFENAGAEDKARMAVTEKKLAEMENQRQVSMAEIEKAAGELAEKNRKADELAEKLAAMEKQMAEKDLALSGLKGESDEGQKLRDTEIALMREEKVAIEKAKLEADERQHAMEAKLAELEEKAKAQEAAEIESRKRADEEHLRIEKEIRDKEAARVLEMEQSKNEKEALEEQIAEGKRQMEEQMKKEQELAEIAKKVAEARASEAEVLRKEKQDIERERKQAQLEAERLKQERVEEKEEIEARQMAAEAETLKAQALADKKTAQEADQRQKIKRLEAKMNHRDRVHSLQRSATGVFSKAEAGDFEAVWGVRVPRFHDRSEGTGAAGHMVFECRMACRGEEWKVFRRYSQFKSLHDVMKKTLPGVVATIKFPPKKWKPNAQFLAQRRLDLEVCIV